MDDIILDYELDTGNAIWKNIGDYPFTLQPKSSVAEWEALIHPKDKARITASFQKALAGGRQQWRGNYWLKGTNNTYHFIRDRRIIKRRENGIPRRFMAVLKVLPQEKELQTRLTRIFEFARIGSWEVDLLTNTLFWSEITREIHKKPVDYTPTLDEAILFYKEGYHRSNIESTFQKVLDGKQDDWNVEAILVTATGEERWVHSFGLVEKVDGSPVRLFGSFQDITEGKLVELNTKRSQKRYQLATKAGTIGIWEWDFSRKRIHLDEVMLDLYGFSPEERNRPLSTLESRLHPDDLPKAYQDLEEAIETGGNYQSVFRICLPDQSVRHIKAFGDIIFDETGQAATMIGVNMDITEEVLQTRNLRRANAEKEEILSSISDGFITIDDNRQMTYCNKAAKSIFNNFRESDEHGGFEAIFLEQEQVRQVLIRCLAQQVTTWSKAYYKETETWLYILFYPKEEGAVCFFRDITEMERSTQIIQNQNERLKHIAWVQSHEVRAPLANILGLTDLLETEMRSGNTDIQEILTMLSSSASRLDAIIRKTVNDTKKMM